MSCMLGCLREPSEDYVRHGKPYAGAEGRCQMWQLTWTLSISMAFSVQRRGFPLLSFPSSTHGSHRCAHHCFSEVGFSQVTLATPFALSILVMLPFNLRQHAHTQPSTPHTKC